MASFGLFDLLSPYYLSGIDLGPTFHPLLAALFVDRLETAFDEEAVTVWGEGRIDPTKVPTLQFSLSVNGSAPQGGQVGPAAAASGGVWDWHDITIRFRLTAPRAASSDVATAWAAAPLNLNSQFRNLNAVLAYFGAGAANVVTDFPGLAYSLDLLLTVATLHLTFASGALLQDDGTLKLDPANPDVRLIFPKLLLTLSQNSNAGNFDLHIDSFGAESIDDPADQALIEGLQMVPQYALVNDQFGFGFDKAIVDLSDSHTPPELLSMYGVGDSWQGVYIPDARIFVKPDSFGGLAIDASVHNLLIGVKGSHGLSGDFELDIVNTATEPYLRVVFYNPDGNTICADCNAERNSSFTVVLPPSFTITAEMPGAIPPYAVALQDSSNGSTVAVTAPYSYTGLTSERDFSFTGTVTTTYPTPADPATPSPPPATMKVHVVPQAMSAVPTPPSLVSAAQMTWASATVPDGTHTVALVDNHNATLRATPYITGTTVSVTDQATPAATSSTPAIASDGTFQVATTAGHTYIVTVTWPKPQASSTPPQPQEIEVKAWFHFDRPPVPAQPQQLNPPTMSFASKPSSAGTPAPNDISPPAGPPEVSDQEDVTLTKTSVPFTSPLATSASLQNFITTLPPNAAVTIEGFASYEHHDTADGYNKALAERRAVALAELIHQAAVERKPPIQPPTFTIEIKSNTLQPDDASETPGGLSAHDAYGGGSDPQAGYVYADYWMARAKYTLPATPAPTGTQYVIAGTLTVPLPQNAPVKYQPVTLPQQGIDKTRPDWFRSIKLLVRIVQSKFIALEISGEVDIATAFKDNLQKQAAMSGAMTAKNLPGNSNPADGFTDFDFIIAHDDATGTWTEQLTLAAVKNDKDGLLQFGKPGAPGDPSPPSGISPLQNILGIFVVFAPLLDALTSSASPSNAEAIQLGGGFALAMALADAGVMQAQTITLYGVELLAREGVASAVAAWFDLEIDLYVDVLGIIKTDIAKPVKVRYKAIGVGYDASSKSHPVVMFDPSKGYTLDCTDPGMFHLPAGLASIIQVLGANIARTNPLSFEITIGIKEDLGVVSVDKAKIRWPIDPFGVPTISALGVQVNIPGAFKGSGYLDLSDGGLAGSLDLTLTPIGLRIAAKVVIRPTNTGATGVAVSLEIDFPSPIVLGSSGLGIYGLLAMFAVNFGRYPATKEPFQWYKDENGDPTNILSSGWAAQVGDWVFAAGAILGTMDGGFVLNLKGVLMFELPGPRLLLFMNANLLVPKLPDLTGGQTGEILATLDLDWGLELVSITLQVNYDIAPLIQIVVPANAIFHLNDPKKFSLDLGTQVQPVSVNVLGLLNATGFLMIEGDGMTLKTPSSDTLTLSGFSISFGMSLALIWGDTNVDFYLEVSASALLAIGFSPFILAGQLVLRGALHLWIVSISASGNLDVLADDKGHASISGSICGKVKFFFFSVSGCIGFSLGTAPNATVTPPLVRKLYLQSRSPALVEGSGVDTQIDGSLGNAYEFTAQGTPSAPQKTFEVNSADGKASPDPTPDAQPIVPIDAFPVLQLGFTPQVASAFTTTPAMAPLAPAPVTGVMKNGWVQRGEMYYRYTLTNIKLTQTLLPGSPAAGKPGAANVFSYTPATTPLVWRPKPGGGGDDTALDLALLDWIPFATPRASQSSQSLDETVTNIFADVCNPVAPGVPVLWTMQHAAIGTSPKGWSLTGLAWPDPPDTQRSSLPPLTLKITEMWRTGIDAIDAMRGVTPAFVVEFPVPCPSTGPSRWQYLKNQTPLPQAANSTLDPGAQNVNVPAAALKFAPNFSTLDAIQFAAQPAIAQGFDPSVLGRVVALAPQAELASQPTTVTATAATAALKIDPAALGRIAPIVNPAAPDAAQPILHPTLPPVVTPVTPPIAVHLPITPIVPIIPVVPTPPIVIHIPPAVPDSIYTRMLVPNPAVATVLPHLTDLAIDPVLLSEHPPLDISSLQPVPATPVATPVYAQDLHSFASTMTRNYAKLCTVRVLFPPSGPMPGKATAAVNALLSPADTPLAKANSDLQNVLVFSTYQLTRVRLYLLVSSLLGRSQLLTVRAMDANGHSLGDQIVANKFIASDADFPAEWSAPGTPWTQPLAVLQQFSHLFEQSAIAKIVVADLTLPAGTDRFLLGLKEPFTLVLPLYGVLGIEGWSHAEDVRASFDLTVKTANANGLDKGLSSDASQLPLMQPGAQYKVEVSYTAESHQASQGEPQIDPASPPVAATTQTFFFQTDTSAPTVLSPWVLATSPAAEELYQFWQDPLTVVFATSAVEQLFEAYGDTLTARVRAANFSATPVQGTGQLTGKISPSPIPTVIKTPFQEALDTLKSKASLGCINDSGSTQQSKQTFHFLLAPSTPYIFDIESTAVAGAQNAVIVNGKPKPPSPASVKPFFRSAFSTSRYATFQDMATDIANAKVGHRVLTGDTTLLTKLSATPTDKDMEDALRAAGLNVHAVPKHPVVTVFWLPGTPATPLAVFFDSPEPLRRVRQTPTAIIDPATASLPPDQQRPVAWEMQRRVWLDLVPDATKTSCVSLTAVSTSGMRAVCLLNSAVGKQVVFNLVRYAFATVEGADGSTPAPALNITLTGAPWEGN